MTCGQAGADVLVTCTRGGHRSPPGGRGGGGLQLSGAPAAPSDPMCTAQRRLPAVQAKIVQLHVVTL